MTPSPEHRRADGEPHLEPFLQLAGLTHDDALIAWGGFWFHPPAGGDADGPWSIIESTELADADGVDRGHSIGVGSAPYGDATVEVHEVDSGRLAAQVRVTEENHAWVRGLTPSTEYRYRVVVDGQGWGEGPLRSLSVDDDGTYRLVPSDRRYDNRFRTFPPPDQVQPVTFAVLGDYGVGMLASSGAGARQARLARALEAAVAQHDVRLVVSTGDNIYLGDEGTAAGSGHEDDDWYFSFHEPYRHVINRVPLYPSIGNHDSSDTEQSDDRQQVARKLFTDLRFAAEAEVGRASIDPGLFYCFRYGADVMFACLDTTLASGLEARHYFAAPEHREFLDGAFPADGAVGDGPRWRFPFCHHPPFCAGPSHPNMEAMITELVPRFERSGVRLVLSGHEHNFQWSEHQGITYLITGAGGKLREEPPEDFEAAHTVAWAAEGHILLVHVDGDRATVRPVVDVASDGTVTGLVPHRPDGADAPDTIVVHQPGT